MKNQTKTKSSRSRWLGQIQGCGLSDSGLDSVDLDTYAKYISSLVSMITMSNVTNVIATHNSLKMLVYRHPREQIASVISYKAFQYGMLFATMLKIAYLY